MKKALQEIFHYALLPTITDVGITDGFLLLRKVAAWELHAEAKKRGMKVTRNNKHHIWIIHCKEVGIGKENVAG